MRAGEVYTKPVFLRIFNDTHIETDAEKEKNLKFLVRRVAFAYHSARRTVHNHNSLFCKATIKSRMKTSRGGDGEFYPARLFTATSKINDVSLDSVFDSPAED